MATKRTTKKAETMAAKKAAKTVAEVKATAAAEVKAEPSKAEAEIDDEKNKKIHPFFGNNCARKQKLSGF